MTKSRSEISPIVEIIDYCLGSKVSFLSETKPDYTKENDSFPETSFGRNVSKFLL